MNIQDYLKVTRENMKVCECNIEAYCMWYELYATFLQICETLAKMHLEFPEIAEDEYEVLQEVVL